MIDRIRSAIERGHVQWQKHSLERMLERGITREGVKLAVMKGSIIEEYKTAVPFPTFLIMGQHGTQALHVVLSFDEASDYCFIITVYKPDLLHFTEDFRTRRK